MVWVDDKMYLNSIAVMFPYGEEVARFLSIQKNILLLLRKYQFR
jgi:hypothetical protein